MSDKANRPPPGQQWVWLTRELLSSDAWRSLTTNSRRFVDFLLLEHMRRGGKDNGRLKAPYRQLVAFGVCPRRTAAYVREAEELGLVDCTRGGMRVANLYALSWLPLHDGAPATNRWRAYRNASLPPMLQPKSRNLPDKSRAGLPDKCQADGPNLPDKSRADSPKNLPDKSRAPSRSSYQGGAVNSDLSAAGGTPAAAQQPWTAPAVVELPVSGHGPRRPVSPQETPPAVSPLPQRGAEQRSEVGRVVRRSPGSAAE